MAHVLHSIPDVPLFFVPGGHRKQGPMLVVFRAVPGMHGTEMDILILNKLSSM